MDPLFQQQLATSAFARNVVNAAVDVDVDDNMDNGDDDDSNYDEDDEDENNADSAGGRRRRRASSRTTNTTSSSSRGASGLADMFAPPHHLICNAGGFEGARTSAKESKR